MIRLPPDTYSDDTATQRNCFASVANTSTAAGILLFALGFSRTSARSINSRLAIVSADDDNDDDNANDKKHSGLDACATRSIQQITTTTKDVDEHPHSSSRREAATAATAIPALASRV